jgi:hypothetical protein
MNQQHLLTTIFSDNPLVYEQSGFDIKGITIYRRNLLANAKRSLAITFPTIFKLLDSDISEKLVIDFLKHSPPFQGDWAQWGNEFSNYLHASDIGQDYPYLADCAALDWSIHRALHGKDQTLTQLSLQLLSTTEPDNIAIELNKNVALIKTKYPITDIYHAHHHTDQLARESTMIRAKTVLSEEPKEHIAMVFRPEFQPEVITLTKSESMFMLCVTAGNSLAESLDVIKNHRDFSFEQWLLTAIKNNLIHYFKEI